MGRILGGLSEIFTRDRLQVQLNGAYQGSSRRSEIETSFPAYGEQARFLTREDFRGGGHLDVGSSLRIWREMAFGASITQVRNSGSAVVTGTVPHPLETGRDRTPPLQTISLPHEQRAVHVYLVWRLRLPHDMEMALSAGPTYFNVRQGVIANLTPMEVGGPPFSDVGLQVDAGEHTRNGSGYNVGVDVTYMLTDATRMPQFGIGYFARATGGSVSIPLVAGSSRRVSVGGVQTGVGLRIRF